MKKTVIQAELPPELTARARSYVEEGLAADLNELLADALRRFLESHSARATETFAMNDVQWGLHGND
ncbi:MAG: CopG family transcriptional regulator [Verrucomicrobiota bacterium]